MKMRPLEKRFVNGAKHGKRVASAAERLVRTADPQPGQRLLDVGCGNGTASIHLARTFELDVTGVDVDPDQVELARTTAADLAAASFVTADATRLPFADGAFDLVFSSKTTHHVPDWRAALEEMTRVLKPGGRLCYSDFVAPIGSRLPTRRGVELFARSHALEIVRESNTPFRCTRVFRVPAGAQADEDDLLPRSGRR